MGVLFISDIYFFPTIFFATFFVLGSAWLFKKSNKEKAPPSGRKELPGPKGYPIFGIFPSLMGKPAHEVFDGWTKTYGNVFQFKLGQNTSVVLGDAGTVRNCMLSKDSAMDSRCQWRECFIETFKGISVLPYSRKWANTRSRTLRILKDMGMGKSSMEENMYYEIDNLIDVLVAKGENGLVDMEPRDFIRRSPMNILCLLMFGERLDYENAKSLYVMNTIVKLVNILMKASIFDILPKQVRRVAGFSLAKNFQDTLANIGDYIADEVHEAKLGNREKNFRYFVDEWLNEVDAQQRRADESGEQLKEISKLTDVLQDVMIAGAHSTGVLLNWIILFLTMYQEEQQKLYDELSSVITQERRPTNTDRTQLVRMDAFLHECHRVATILPLVAHATWLDTKVNGYDVSKNIEVVYNNWSINHDEKVFPEPFKFNTDRWINDEGKLRADLQEKFFPYGIGKRSCVGKSLAKMQIFLTTANIVKRLKILPPSQGTPDELKPQIFHQVGMMAECKPFLCRIQRRGDDEEEDEKKPEEEEAS